MSAAARLLRLSPHLRRLRRAAGAPVAAQEAVLRRLLGHAAGTEWGRRYGFAELAAEPAPGRAYAERVPLASFSAYAGAIERCVAGEADILWPGRYRWFATSAGTTGAGQTIPVSDETMRHNYAFGAAAFLSHVVATGSAAALGGTPLALTGAIAEMPGRPGVMTGEISGLIAEHLRSTRGPLGAIRRRKTMPPRIRDLDDWEQKIDALADYAMERDVRVFVGVPGWGLGFFDRLLERYRRRHRRAAQTVARIWPRLELVISGGAPLAAYRRALAERIGPAPVRFVETYGASEGFVAFQAEPDEAAMQLHLDCGVYFEFVRQDELDSPAPRRYGIGEVETGVCYALYLTTSSGFWSYAVGDLVRFTSLRPHRIVVAGRIGDLLDSYGEKVSGEQIRRSLRQTAEAAAVHCLEVHVTPRPAAGGRRHALQWFIEFAPPPRDLAAFAADLDRRLMALNPMYASCRRQKGFGQLEVVALPRGAFQEWHASGGRRLGAQSKTPLTSESREVAEFLLDWRRRQAAASGDPAARSEAPAR